MMEALVAGDDGWISDESSFYGDDDTKEKWEESVTDRAEIYWKIAPSLPANIAASNLNTDHKVASTNVSDIYWPFEGHENARQSTESPEGFVKRLPPSKSRAKDYGEWLWIHNARSPPVDKNLDEDTFVEAGRDILASYTKAQGSAKKNYKALAGDREKLKDKLVDLAKDHHCLCGKWLLFVPNDHNLDKTWQTVVKAVANNHLGPLAKIATQDGKDGVRLICVYTRDFTNLKDVQRVLEALVNLGLVDAKDKQGIWYKSNAYTLLGIEGKNPYGLRNSMYGSKEMLGHNNTSWKV